MEPLFQYGGYIEIDRGGEREGEVLRLPFSFDSPFILPVEGRDAEAFGIAQRFLDLLRDTAPSHRPDYGEARKVVFTSLVQLNFGA